MGSVRNITIIFENLDQSHLYKDVGLVPYYLAKIFDAQLTFVYKGTRTIDNPYSVGNVRFLKVENCGSYLKAHATTIDILMLFHLATRTIGYGMSFKKLNPNGYLYIKYDCEEVNIPYLHEKAWYALSRYKRGFYFKRFAPYMDLLSVECRKVFEGMQEFDTTRLYHLPNGAAASALDDDSGDLQTAPKENIVLLVARHGSYQKNTEMIFHVLPLLGAIGDWKFIFVGPVTDSFVQQADRFVKENPELSHMIVIAGNVSDRLNVADYYKRAKILCLPSRSEGFPIVCSEALGYGVVVCMSKEVVSSYDITKNGEIGFPIPREDHQAWARTLRTLMTDDALLGCLSEASREYFNAGLSWEVTIPRLAERIEQDLQRRVPLHT